MSVKISRQLHSVAAHSNYSIATIIEIIYHLGVISDSTWKMKFRILIAIMSKVSTEILLELYIKRS